METKILNFKKLEVSGNTKEEALEKAPFFIQGDATMAFENFKKRSERPITEKEIKQFCLDYLAMKSKNAPGIGYAITQVPAVKNTRVRPYRVLDVKNTKGKRKFSKTYQLFDKKTGALLAETNETKAKAEALAKKFYTEKGFTGNIKCTVTKQVIEGEPVAFEMEYVPSKKACVGTYLVFGIEA